MTVRIPAQRPAQTAAKRLPRAPLKATPRWIGCIDGIHEGLLLGWAANTMNPSDRVVVEVCLNGEPLGAFTADSARTDILDALQAAFGNATFVDCCHGFVASLRSVDLGTEGQLTVRIANTDATLDGSIHLAAQTPPPLATTSLVYGDGGIILHGWAIDAHRPTHTVGINAYVGSERVAQGIANAMTPSLRARDLGARGFTLALPLRLADGENHQVRVVDDLGNPLNGSPVTICCHLDGGQALLGVEELPALAGTVLQSYQRYAPKGLGMDHYQDWAAHFERPDPATAQSKKKHPLKVAILIYGTADAGAFATTQACIRAQRGVVVHAYCTGNAHTAHDSLSSALSAMLAGAADVIGFVRAGDTLPEHALLLALQGFAGAGAQVVYTDSEQAGKPWFKPAWNKEYALATDHPLELLLVRTALVKGAHTAAESANVAGLCWRVLAQAQKLGEHAIVHVPRVLYRYHSALSPAEQTARLDAARSALKTMESGSRLEPLPVAQAGGVHTARRLQRGLSAKHRKTKVSLIIPTRDHAPMLERCINSLQKHTHWPQLEIIVVDNGSALAATKTYFAKLRRSGVKVMPLPGPFNFARLNNQAVAAAAGEVVGLINNDIEALHSGWLDEMLGHLLQPDIGAVGAKLLWPNGMVQHGGVLLGVGHVAGHFGNVLADADAGDHARNQVVQRVSGVTAACLLVRKQDYLAVGGMNEDLFPVAFNDVDLCLKLRRMGKAIVWTPHATLLHAESASRGHEDSPQKKARAHREIDNLRRLWGPELLRDPYYHPSFNLDAHTAPFQALALPPRNRTPRTPALDVPVPSITKANL